MRDPKRAYYQAAIADLRATVRREVRALPRTHDGSVRDLDLAMIRYMADGHRDFLAPPAIKLALWVWKADHSGGCRYRRIAIPITRPNLGGTGANAGRHMQLKSSAMDWLTSLGIHDAEFEIARVNYPGIPDVAAPRRKIALECGDTDPEKLVFAAQAGWIVLWLPYFDICRSFVTGRKETEYTVGCAAEALLISAPAKRRGIALSDPAKRGRVTGPDARATEIEAIIADELRLAGLRPALLHPSG